MINLFMKKNNNTALNNSFPNEDSEYKNKMNETRLNFVRKKI